MDSTFYNLDAALFLQIWQHFDTDDNGFIKVKELDAFFQHLMKSLGVSDEMTKKKVRRLKEKLTSTYGSRPDGHLHIQELAKMLLPEDEKFLLLFRREIPLNNSVEFMRVEKCFNIHTQIIPSINYIVFCNSNADHYKQGEIVMSCYSLSWQIWRNYDTDSSGYISAAELQGFLKDLFLHHKKEVSSDKLQEYADTMMALFDKNKDGHLDLNHLARILALKENFLLKFEMDACSQEDRKRDFEKIFAHYDVSKTGALEGPEVDGFVKDMMELVKPNLTGGDPDKFRRALLSHCDINGDGKIQKNELALCLGLKLS
ncbi:secretagogin-like isoform X1 [Denticeps clupeoides]|uniref:Secretagogin n=1 Tax=Denticeps clupeoides TaxID=299321 RepID=A0AAY4CVF4_9TELE|nr:secretagogin-like isoform X1 [Denticeps clupeoides]XP_028821991.1 secretagogin-like isoform X1 [Denticeps clupeoides]